MIDSFTTGRQQGLSCRGVRAITAQDKQRRVDKVLKEHQKDLPDPGIYMVLAQGIWATSDPIVNSQPIIREGSCGAAIVRLAIDTEGMGATSPRKKRKSEGKVTPTKRNTDRMNVTNAENDLSNVLSASGSDKEMGNKIELTCLNTGEVAGFMHWCDLQEKGTYHSRPQLFCYAEVTVGSPVARSTVRNYT
ncbi:hypothetical protein B7463_g8286, partial [Scytalidium lignicola]